MKVAVIGAGVVGISTAYALHRAGVEVTVLDRQPAAGLETSFANGALLHPSLVDPWNSPGILKVLVNSLGKEDSAVLLRLKALPSLIGWGIRFVRQSAPQCFEANALRNLRLAQYSLSQMKSLRDQTGIHYDEYQRGLMTLFRDTAAQQAMRAWYAKLAAHGLEFEWLSPRQSVDKEPALAPVETRLTGALFAPQDEGGDSARFCTELAQYLVSRGVVMRFNEPVTRLVRQGNRIARLELGTGDVISADRYVLAAGSYSTPLADAVGIHLPVRPAKGYSLTLPRGSSGMAPLTPVSDTSLHMAVIPVGPDHVRVAGTAEFTGFDTGITQGRVDNLLRLLQQLYPRFASTLDGVERRPWTGLRPMCADGVPVIGPSAIDNLFINTGHGHLGWTLAAGSGRVAADLIVGRLPEVDARDYSLDRFN